MMRPLIFVSASLLLWTFAACAQATHEITYRLETDALINAPDHGSLIPDVPGYNTGNRWHETYLQEFRAALVGKASSRAGYRIEPRVDLTYARDSAVTSDWVLDQGYAYADFSDHLSLFVGKQRIRWGTGMTYTPTDRLQPVVNTLDPTRYLEGVLMSRLSLSLPLFSASALYSPRRAIEDTLQPADRLAGIRLYKLIGTTDLYLSMTHNLEHEVNLGAAFSSDTGPVVLYGEAAYLRSPQGSLPGYLGIVSGDEWRPRAVLGINRQITANTFGYIEGYYDGWGLDAAQYKVYRNRVNTDIAAIQIAPLSPAILDYANLISLAKPTLGLRQFYVAMSGSYDYRSLISVSGNAVYEPDGGTLYAYPFVSYVGYENLDIMAGVSAVFGGDHSEKIILPAFYAVDLRFIVYF